MIRLFSFSRRGLLAFVVALALLPIDGRGDNPSAREGSGLTKEQRRRADQIISIFENDTEKLQYGYAENLKDGRGLTAGRGGFTSATGDLLLVVQRYVEKVPDSRLAAYLPRLKALAREASASTRGLGGLAAAWKAAAKDPRFRAIQDQVVDKLYYQPAVDHWRKLELCTPLSLLVLYDTAIQQGDDNDPDGLPAVIQRTNQRAGGSPAKGAGEKAWLRAFLKVRRATLAHANDPETRKAWSETVIRCDVLRKILEEGNFDLRGPIVVRPYGRRFVLP